MMVRIESNSIFLNKPAKSKYTSNKLWRPLGISSWSTPILIYINDVSVVTYSKVHHFQMTQVCCISADVLLNGLGQIKIR